MSIEYDIAQLDSKFSPRPANYHPSSNPLGLSYETQWTDQEEAMSTTLRNRWVGGHPGSPGPLPRTSTMKRGHGGPSGTIQRHFPLITGGKGNSIIALDDDDTACACCNPQQTPPPPPPMKRSLVEMGAGGLGALRRLGAIPQVPSVPPPLRLPPVCPVPMPQAFAVHHRQQEYPRPSTQSTRTPSPPSPPSNEPTTNHERSRRSSAALLSSIKKTITRIRRSVSRERVDAGADSEEQEASPAMPTRPATEAPSTASTASTVRWTLLRRFSDGSRLIEMRRHSTCEKFGVSIQMDTKGLYVSRLCANAASHTLIRRGDRVLQIQHFSGKRLPNADSLRGLLQGCHVATIRVKSNSR